MEESPYYTPWETATPDQRRRYLTQRLRQQVEHAYRNSPFYRRKFEAAGVRPDDVHDLEDLSRLPFTSKDELKQSQAAHPPYGDFLAVPLERCIQFHQTSGTTGRPVVILDTEDDWKGFYQSYARALWAMGVRPRDVVMTAFGFGPWIGYWSGFYAANDLGAMVIPNGGMTTEQRIRLILDYGVTVLGGTPSYVLYLIEEARRLGIDLSRESQLRITWHTGEPGASIPSTKRKLEAGTGARCFDLPGLTEMAAWGFECSAQSGLVHIHDDYTYPEVLHPETLQPVSPGEQGELVLTNLYRRAMPLLRYRTRDIVRLANRPCPCGRTLISIEGGVLGRLDDMKKIRGVIVYPSQVEEVVRAHPEVDEFQTVFDRQGGLDTITVRLDINPALTTADGQQLAAVIANELRNALGIRAETEVVPTGTLPRFDHKAKRWIDRREEVPF